MSNITEQIKVVEVRRVLKKYSPGKNPAIDPPDEVLEQNFDVDKSGNLIAKNE